MALINVRRAWALHFTGALLSCGAIGLAACHGKGSATPAPAIVVALPVHAAGGTDAGAIRYPVEVAARYSNSMSFRVPGKLIERAVRLGDRVRKGQALARLDPADAERQAASARAALDAAASRLAFAKQQLDRDSAQNAANLISAMQLEQTQDAYRAAQAAQEQAADQLVVARNSLAYNTLVADHDGLITSENADTGQVVTAGQAVYGLAWSGDTDVVLDAAASDVGSIALGEAATVTFPALPRRSFHALVREISPAADPQSRTYRVKLTLEDAGSSVRIGMTGDATLAAAAGSADGAGSYRVPATALFHRGKEPAVWVIQGRDSTLELRAVQVASFGERSVTITQGLRDGDTVLIAGVHTVYEGERVTAVKPLFSDEEPSSRSTAETSP